MCKEYTNILKLCTQVGVGYKDMLEFDINDINAIGDGLIDKRETLRCDILTSVYHGCLIAIENCFSDAKIDKLPYLRLRAETQEEIVANALNMFKNANKVISEEADNN